MKIMVLLWSTSVAKDSNIVPSLFFSHFFSFLGLFSFFMAFIFFGAFSFFMAFPIFLFLTWDNALENDDHHTSIYLQLNDYNSILAQRWLYMNASGGVPGCAMNQEWHVWKNYERWLCHKYYVNYMIMLSNMTMMNVSWWMEWWKVAWQYISEWLWKCHNR